MISLQKDIDMEKSKDSRQQCLCHTSYRESHQYVPCQYLPSQCTRLRRPHLWSPMPSVRRWSIQSQCTMRAPTAESTFLFYTDILRCRIGLHALRLDRSSRKGKRVTVRSTQPEQLFSILSVTCTSSCSRFQIRLHPESPFVLYPNLSFAEALRDRIARRSCINSNREWEDRHEMRRQVPFG
jgi:hypothetical protein